MSDYLDTLNLPFDRAILPAPKAGEHWLMLNAQPMPVADTVWADHLTCEQGFRPDYNALVSAEYDVHPLVQESEVLDGALLALGRVRRVNEDNLIRCWNSAKTGSYITVCGDKNSGVHSLRKWAAKQVTIDGSLSKHHAVVFWLRKEEGTTFVHPKELVASTSDDTGFQIASGMFSASGPDKGSKLLSQFFDHRIRGRVADFGSGWGYLSSKLLENCPSIEQLELYEADWQSLEAAKLNLTSAASPLEFHWCDVMSEPPRGPFQWIIMNPPFHTGRAAEPNLGQHFIQAAAKALPAGGRLLMVANVNLPYERTLNEVFKKVETKAREGGFKIIEAVR